MFQNRKFASDCQRDVARFNNCRRRCTQGLPISPLCINNLFCVSVFYRCSVCLDHNKHFDEAGGNRLVTFLPKLAAPVKVSVEGGF